MGLLNYGHLRYFWAVAHDGNLTRTAARLNVTQSALSVQIRQLETRLGHELFERRGRQLRLTEAGRIALDHADTIFATGEELLSTMRTAGAARQELRVGALATLSRNFQIDFLRPVLGRPDLDIVLRSGSAAELLQALQALSLDVVLLNTLPASEGQPRFVTHRLAEQPVSLVGVAAKMSEAASPEQLLAAHPVIVPTTGTGIRAGFDAWADRLGLRPRIAAEVEDRAMMRLLVREGLGLAVLPPIVVKDELASGALRAAAPLPGIVESFYAVTVSRRFPHPLLPGLLAPRSAAQ